MKFSIDKEMFPNGEITIHKKGAGKVTDEQINKNPTGSTSATVDEQNPQTNKPSPAWIRLSLFFAAMGAVLQGPHPLRMIAAAVICGAWFAIPLTRGQRRGVLPVLLTLAVLIPSIILGFPWVTDHVDSGSVTKIAIVSMLASLMGYVFSAPKVRAVKLDRGLAIAALIVTITTTIPLIDSAGRPQTVHVLAWGGRPADGSDPAELQYHDVTSNSEKDVETIGEGLDIQMPYPALMPSFKLTTPVVLNGKNLRYERTAERKSTGRYIFRFTRQEFFNILSLGVVRDDDITISFKTSTTHK